MCSPTAMAATMAAISGGKTMAGIASKNKAAETKAESAKAEAEQNLDLLETRQDQTIESGVEKKQSRQLQGKRERAKLQVAFGNTGVTGNTPLRQLHTSMIQQGKDVGQIQTNVDNELQQIEHEQQAVTTRAEGRIEKAEARTTTGAMAGLQIIGSAAQGGMSGYSQGKSMQASSGG